MNISRNLLKQIIKEELRKVLNETRLEHRFRFYPELPEGVLEIYAEKLNSLLKAGEENIQSVILMIAPLSSQEEAEAYVYETLVVDFFKENADEYKLDKDWKGFHLYILGEHNTTGLSTSIPAKTLPYDVSAKEMYEEVMDLKRMKGFYSDYFR